MKGLRTFSIVSLVELWHLLHPTTMDDIPTIEAEPGFLITNAHVYRDIAMEAFSRADTALRAGRRPMPNGEAGNIIRAEPDRPSFKNSLITIAFAGMYLEALLYIEGTKRFKKGPWMKRADRTPIWFKLWILGVEGSALLEAAKEFVAGRNDLIHEKALQSMAEMTTASFSVAQDQAKKAIEFIRDASAALEVLAQMCGE